jgi:hypothetical protein
MNSKQIAHVRATMFILIEEADTITQAKKIKANMKYWARLQRAKASLVEVLIEVEKGAPRL